jgi:glutamine---fructose-6-phosphate transaminase (isomerizing)
MKEMALKWEHMRHGIDGQADLLRQAPGKLHRELQSLLADRTPSRIYLVGCGDSYYCGLATRYAIERYTGIVTEPLESLEFSRYAIRSAPADSLVVAVSNSGEVARTVECLQFARQQGLATLGITYNPEGRLAAAAEETLQYDYRDVGFGPGTMSYVASMLALLVTGLRVAEVAGTMTPEDVQGELRAIEALGDTMQATVTAGEKGAVEVAEGLSDETDVFFLGGGPNYGTALFAMAKMIESSRHNSIGQELEEWAHEQYFCTRPGTVTVVIAPPGASVDRAREQLQAIRDVGGTAVAVCAEDDEETASLADITIPVVGHVDELLSPLVYCAAPELIAYHFAVRAGKVMLGFDDANRKEVNFRQIFRSDIPDELPALGGRP